jgi:hypothetical protein
MDKQQKLKIALPVLAVVMAFVWGPILTGSGPKKKGRSDAVVVTPEADGPTRNADLVALARLGQRKKSRTAYPDWGRNPFALVEYSSNVLVLEGILWDEKNPQAIINGNIISVGGRIDSYVVSEITQTSAVVDDGTSRTQLRLGDAK